MAAERWVAGSVVEIAVEPMVAVRLAAAMVAGRLVEARSEAHWVAVAAHWAAVAVAATVAVPTETAMVAAVMAAR